MKEAEEKYPVVPRPRRTEEASSTERQHILVDEDEKALNMDRQRQSGLNDDEDEEDGDDDDDDDGDDEVVNKHSDHSDSDTDEQPRPENSMNTENLNISTDEVRPEDDQGNGSDFSIEDEPGNFEGEDGDEVQGDSGSDVADVTPLAENTEEDFSPDDANYSSATPDEEEEENVDDESYSSGTPDEEEEDIGDEGYCGPATPDPDPDETYDYEPANPDGEAGDIVDGTDLVNAALDVAFFVYMASIAGGPEPSPTAVQRPQAMQDDNQETTLLTDNTDTADALQTIGQKSEQVEDTAPSSPRTEETDLVVDNAVPSSGDLKLVSEDEPEKESLAHDQAQVFSNYNKQKHQHEQLELEILQAAPNDGVGGGGSEVILETDEYMYIALPPTESDTDIDASTTNLRSEFVTVGKPEIILSSKKEGQGIWTSTPAVSEPDLRGLVTEDEKEIDRNIQQAEVQKHEDIYLDIIETIPERSTSKNNLQEGNKNTPELQQEREQKSGQSM
ncbi:unnamed protein product, partial [Amoebophrya sp. A25]|eukprot:GSA25T00013379001.1